MTEKAHEKAPSPAVVERAQEKADAGEDLNQREAAALEAQEESDRKRGYRRILLHPAQGIYAWQHVVTLHTTADGEGGELEMRRHHLEYLAGQAR